MSDERQPRFPLKLEPSRLAIAWQRHGYCRSLRSLASFHQWLPPHNKGMRYPPDPPTVEESISVKRTAGDDADGVRLRALIIVLWRAGLRISEALALAETDLDPVRGAILSVKARAANVARSAWTAGRGSGCSRGSSCARRCPWGRSFASCTALRPVAGAARRGRAHSCIAQQPQRVSAALCTPSAQALSRRGDV